MAKRVTRIAGWILLYLVLTLGGAELLCRWLGRGEPNPYAGNAPGLFITSDIPGLGYTMRSTFDGHVYGTSLRTNNYGLRGSIGMMRRPLPETSRVLCLGDSICFGYGVQEAQTFPCLLQEKMTSGEVINAGVPGYNASQSVVWLREVGFDLAPDAVVFVYVPNDPESVRPLSEEGYLLPAKTDPWVTESKQPLRVLQWLGQWSHFFAFGDALTAPRLASGKAQIERVVSYFNHGVFEQPGWEACQASLRELGDLCRERHIPVIVGIHPILMAWKQYPFKDHERRVEEACSEAGLLTVNLRSAYSAFPAGRVKLHPQDGHPGELGHRIMSDVLAAQLAVLLEPKVPPSPEETDNSPPAPEVSPEE